MMMPYDDASVIHGDAPIEVFAARARRRPCSDEDKARIVAESYAGDGSTVCDVASSNGICLSQLVTWRRQLRRTMSVPETPLFVPAVVEDAVLMVESAAGMSRAVRRQRGQNLAADRPWCRCTTGHGSSGRAEGQPMTVPGPTGATRVLLATRPVDSRKGMDGLTALVTAELRGGPFAVVVYVFRAKKADRIKLVWWDCTGLS